MRSQAESTMGIISTNDSYTFLQGQATKLAELLEEIKGVFNKNKSRQEFQSLSFKDWKSIWGSTKQEEAESVIELTSFKDELHPLNEQLLSLLAKLNKHIKTELGK